MRLVDVRRLAVRRRIRIRFRLSNGMECIVNEQGVVRLPELRHAPQFDLEEEIAKAAQFSIEEAVPAPGNQRTKPRPLSRAELDALSASAPGPQSREEHEE